MKCAGILRAELREKFGDIKPADLDWFQIFKWLDEMEKKYKDGFK